MTIALAHPAMKTKIIFLCTDNSCRSQMAEGWETLQLYEGITKERRIQ